MLTQRYSATHTAVLFGLSTDTKPVDAPNGSVFYEMDTSKAYSFDQENKLWYEVPLIVLMEAW